MRCVSARVSISARPISPRQTIQPSRSLAARQLAAGVGRARKMAPTAARSAPPSSCSTSSKFTPTLPMCGKVKATICD